MNTSELFNIIQKEEFAEVVFKGVSDLSDFFHTIKFSKKVSDLGDDSSIKSLIFILNTFFVNQITEMAAKATFIENATGRKMDRKERMILVAQDSLEMQKGMFEAVIDYQVKRNDARK